MARKRQILNCFFEASGTEQIVLLATFNVESAVLNQKKIIWKQLVDNFDEINCIYDWDKFEEKVIAEREFDEQDYELTEPVLREKIQSIHNMSEFLALSQAFYNLQNLYHKFEIEKFDVSKDLKFKIYKMYIKTCAETNAIVEGFEAKSSLNALVDNDEKRFEYYVMQAFLEMANKQFTEARETIRIARQFVNGEQKRFQIL